MLVRALFHFTCLAASAVVFACQPAGSKPEGPVSTCTSAGPACVFQEGKLGLCVLRAEPCDGKPCYVCQSQH